MQHARWRNGAKTRSNSFRSGHELTNWSRGIYSGDESTNLKFFELNAIIGFTSRANYDNNEKTKRCDALALRVAIEATLDESLRGSAPVMEAVANGTLDLAITTSPYVAPLVDSDSATALVVVHPSRIPLLPSVPTMLERGILRALDR